MSLEDGTMSTPFEIAHHVKPDLRLMFKPFALAAVRRERNGDATLQKFDSQSLPMIVLGRCPVSNGLQFYNPVNGSIVSSIDYTIQHHVTSGSKFGYKYQPGTFVYQLDESTTMYAPKFPLDSTVLVHTHTPPHKATIIGIPTYSHPDIYTVKFQDGTIAEYSSNSNILEGIPITTSVDKSNLLPEWIKGGCTATLFLNDMSKPIHGRLYEDSDDAWIFCTGNKFEASKGTYLHNFPHKLNNYLKPANYFEGILNCIKYIKLVNRSVRKIAFYVMGQCMVFSPLLLLLH